MYTYIHQEGQRRDLASSGRGVSTEVSRTARPKQAVGPPVGEGRRGHGAEERDGGGGGGGGTRAGRARGSRSLSFPLEGLQKSGCFVTPKKVRDRVMKN